MNHFDQASRYGAKLDPPGFIQWLLRQPREQVTFTGWIDARRLPFPGNPDRTGDTVARLREQADPERAWALPIEFQIEPDSEMFGRLMVYEGMIWMELRPSDERGARYAVMGAVVNLTGRGQSGRDMELAGGRTCLLPIERNLCDEDAATMLAGIAAGTISRCMLAWIPLMQGGGEAGIIERWIELALAEPNEKRRGKYAGLALVFADAAGCKPAWKEALKGWNMKQSEQVLEWMAEGRAEGEIKGQVKLLLQVLAARFPSGVPADLANLIRTTATSEKLERWGAAAGTVTSLDEFRRIAEQNGE
jgi:hypothetical protein